MVLRLTQRQKQRNVYHYAMKLEIHKVFFFFFFHPEISKKCLVSLYENRPCKFARSFLVIFEEIGICINSKFCEKFRSQGERQTVPTEPYRCGRHPFGSFFFFLVRNCSKYSLTLMQDLALQQNLPISFSIISYQTLPIVII